MAEALGRPLMAAVSTGRPRKAILVKAIFVESLRKHIQTVGPFPAVEGAIQMFDKVRHSANTRIAIATGGWRKFALLKLESTGFNIDGIPVATCAPA